MTSRIALTTARRHRHDRVRRKGEGTNAPCPPQKIRQKATRETQDLKEEIARKEQIKEAARKRQEKLDDQEAKRRIKAKIEADKEERRRKA